MKNYSLILSTEMVKSTLAGRKLCTRRLPSCTNSLVDGKRISGKAWKALAFAKTYGISDNAFYFFSQTDERHHRVEPIYQPGDKLWFRETWNLLTYGDHSFYGYAADGGHHKDRKWRPSIHMPKSACRLWADCGTVTCEHLQDITDKQAKEEGILWFFDEAMGFRFKDYIADARGYGHPEHDYPSVANPVTSFGTLWQSIHGPDSFTANPPVYAINFNPTTRKP